MNVKQREISSPQLSSPKQATNEEPFHTFFFLQEKLREHRPENANPHADANEFQSKLTPGQQDFSCLVRRVRNQDGVHCLKRRVDIKVKEEGRKGEPVRMGSETRFPPRSPGLPELTMALGTH